MFSPCDLEGLISYGFIGSEIYDFEGGLVQPPPLSIF